jgi:hypothetical protein
MIATSAGVAVVAAGHPLASTASGSRPRPTGEKEATVTVRGHTVRATLGSYCLPGNPDGSDRSQAYTCADAFATPGTRRKLAVAPRDRVLVTTGAKAKRVYVGLVRTTRRGQSYVGGRRAHRRAGHPRRWLMRLPRRLRRADLLDVAVEYREGDADFGVSIRRRRR